MNLFLYLPRQNNPEKRLTEVFATLNPGGAVKRMRSFRQVAASLRRPLDNRDVYILHIPTGRHLEELLPIASLLERIRLIIILPDSEAGTIALAHQFRPRFLTTADRPYGDLAAVLKKMAGAARPAVWKAG